MKPPATNTALGQVQPFMYDSWLASRPRTEAQARS
jgi:hypothetical protein